MSQNVFDEADLKALRAIPDVKESFESGNVDDETQPNIWLPEEVLPGFRGYDAPNVHGCTIGSIWTDEVGLGIWRRTLRTAED